MENKNQSTMEMLIKQTEIMDIKIKEKQMLIPFIKLLKNKKLEKDIAMMNYIHGVLLQSIQKGNLKRAVMYYFMLWKIECELTYMESEIKEQVTKRMLK